VLFKWQEVDEITPSFTPRPYSTFARQVRIITL